jgi:predicted RNA-binding protein with PIN domain
MSTWLIDGMNVVGSTPDGWWRDRRGAMRRLAQSLARYASETGEQITVVFDGKPFDVDAPPVEIAFAPHADDEIERIVGAAPEPAGITVVTSDRELAERVGAHGAAVFPSRAFRSRLI